MHEWTMDADKDARPDKAHSLVANIISLLDSNKDKKLTATLLSDIKTDII